MGKAIGGATAGVVLQVGASLLQATGSVLNEAADVSSELVQKKFGKQAGDATREGLQVVGNVFPLVQIPKLFVLGSMAQTAGQMSGSVSTGHANVLGALVPTVGPAPGVETKSTSPTASVPLKTALSDLLSEQDSLPRASTLAALEGGGIQRVLYEAACAIEEGAVTVASNAAGFVRQQTQELTAA